MKNLLFLILPFFALGQSFEVVDSPAYYYVLADTDTISRHTKESKAILKAAETSLTKDNVVLLRPKATFNFSGDVAVDLSDVYARLDSLEFANDLQGMAINDIYNEEIPRLNGKINYLDTLNRRKYDILQARLNNMVFPQNNDYSHLETFDNTDNLTFDDRAWDLVDNRLYFNDSYDAQVLEIAIPNLEVGKKYVFTVEVEGDFPLFTVSVGGVTDDFKTFLFTAKEDSNKVIITAKNSQGATDFYLDNLTIDEL